MKEIIDNLEKIVVGAEEDISVSKEAVLTQLKKYYKRIRFNDRKS